MVFSVTQINGFIKNTIDAEAFFEHIEISGEVSGFKISGGFGYFTLKDEYTQISCVAFGIQRTYNPKEGENVIVSGKIDYYEKYGKLSVKVFEIKPYGMGKLYAKYLKLKADLEKEGLFALDHKKPIPRFPKKIGIITSKTGAVIKDIINVGTRRNPNINIVLLPVKVQGAGADLEIASALEIMDRQGVDTIIIGRGGGSLEDLEAFYKENVVRAVYNCKTPVISAVGHETDFSLCDLAADLRAPTPSAAAELAIPDIKEEKIKLKHALIRLDRAIKSLYSQKANQLIRNCDKLIKLADNIYTSKKYELLANITYLKSNSLKSYDEEKNRMDKLILKFDSLSPLKILKKGYASVTKGENIVFSINNVNLNDRLNIRFCDGTAEAEVKNIKKFELGD